MMELVSYSYTCITFLLAWNSPLSLSLSLLLSLSPSLLLYPLGGYAWAVRVVMGVGLVQWWLEWWQTNCKCPNAGCPSSGSRESATRVLKCGCPSSDCGSQESATQVPKCRLSLKRSALVMCVVICVASDSHL
ncbi:uncharacterized protein EV422DRAFT_516081 [Fimicolochytrium jonesii]|uniref:uncharacterized protein n=1 Tax=Fimicolochytrium jonesii TaxID=1396493 RepID=UPI0022FEE18F|nr:uncharacterized protein EV422DRAFT_516081 [Fimicolochytrium jonesii]KAI8826282.1 hypothetical protein EV422DRAFT_516081 [Fimicolochytrium jonesii]